MCVVRRCWFSVACRVLVLWFLWSFDVSLSFSFLFDCYFKWFLCFILCCFFHVRELVVFSFAFSTIQFSLDHSNLFSNSFLALASVDLHSCFRCCNNYSVSSLFCGVLRYSSFFRCQCFWLFRVASSSKYLEVSIELLLIPSQVSALFSFFICFHSL